MEAGVARPVTIRESLIRGFAPVVLVVALSAFALLFFAGRFAVETLSAALIDQTYERVSERLDGFFEPVLLEMEELSQDVRVGALDPDDENELRERFRRVVSSVPHVSAALLAEPSGREVMALRLGDEWVSHVIPEGGMAGVQRRWRRGGEARESAVPEGRDPRMRPWFRAAVAGAGEFSWTPPYEFFESGAYGVTLSREVTTAEGRRVILALDVLLHELDEFTRSMELRRGGLVYLLDDRGRVLGLPNAPEFEDEAARVEALMKEVESIGNRLAIDAEEAYFGVLEREGAEVWERPYRFMSAGESYWGQAVEREIAGGLALMPAIIVAEKDLLGPIVTARWIAVGVGLLAVGWAVWKCFRLARRFSGPIEALADESDRIIRGSATLDHEPLSSGVVELAKLSSSQVEMRQAMRTLGKMERDIQVAREIQEALLPASLPTLDGWSVAGWSDPADETGGDIYDVVQMNGAGDVYFLLADATGHGVGPAISAAQVRAMTRMALRSGTDLRGMVTNLNAQLREDLPAGRFITLWCARLDPGSGELHTFSAGQAPLLRYRAAEDGFETFDASVPPLGVVDALGDVEAERHGLGAGDFYAVFSDGIFEARSPEGELFGVERACAAMRSANGTAEGVIAAVRGAVERFTRGAAAADDQTGVVVMRDAGIR